MLFCFISEPRGRKNKNKQDNELKNIENLMGEMDISRELVLKQPVKKKSKLKGLQTLDQFLLKEVPITANYKEDTNVNFSSLSHSTPKSELRRSKSCHYLSNNCDLQKNTVLTNKACASLEDITCDTIPSNQTHNSFNLSFLEASGEDDAALDLSDVVNSIVSRSCCNPAVRIWTNKFM